MARRWIETPRSLRTLPRLSRLGAGRRLKVGEGWAERFASAVTVAVLLRSGSAVVTNVGVYSKATVDEIVTRVTREKVVVRETVSICCNSRVWYVQCVVVRLTVVVTVTLSRCELCQHPLFL